MSQVFTRAGVQKPSLEKYVKHLTFATNMTSMWTGNHVPVSKASEEFISVFVNIPVFIQANG